MESSPRSSAAVIAITTPSCPNCRAMKPIVDQVGRDFAGDVELVAIDASLDPEAAAELGVRGVPTYIARQDGREVARHTGRMDPPQMRALFGAAVSGDSVEATLGATDRGLRLAAAAVFGVSGVATSTWALIALGAGALVFATWDLVARR